MPIHVQIGKYYRMRNGSYVLIETVLHRGSRLVAIGLVDHLKPEFFTNGGKCTFCDENGDIVAGPFDTAPQHVYHVEVTTTSVYEVTLPSPNYIPSFVDDLPWADNLNQISSKQTFTFCESPSAIAGILAHKETFLKTFFEQNLQCLDGYNIHHIESNVSQTGKIQITIVADGLASFSFTPVWQIPDTNNLSNIQTKYHFVQDLLTHCSLGGYEVTKVELQRVDEDDSFTVLVIADCGAELTFKTEWTQPEK